MRHTFRELVLPLLALTVWSVRLVGQIGSEVAVPVHLQDGQEFTTPLDKLLKFGKSLFYRQLDD